MMRARRKIVPGLRHLRPVGTALTVRCRQFRDCDGDAGFRLSIRGLDRQFRWLVEHKFGPGERLSAADDG